MNQLPPDGTIVGETIAEIAGILGPDAERISIERVVIGLFFTGVKLSSGAAGTAATPIHAIPEAVCCPSSAMTMPFPGKLHGRRATDLLKEAVSPHPIRRAVGIATMNALADMCWDRQPDPAVELRSGVDAYDAARIQPGEHVVVVGAFVPFLRALKQAGQRFTILEIDPRTLKPEEMPFFRPADQAPEVVPTADVLLMTGTTLLNDTMEGLLALCRPDARVVVVGPDGQHASGRLSAPRCRCAGRRAGHPARRVPGHAVRGWFRLPLLRPVGGEGRTVAAAGEAGLAGGVIGF